VPILVAYPSTQTAEYFAAPLPLLFVKVLDEGEISLGDSVEWVTMGGG